MRLRHLGMGAASVLLLSGAAAAQEAPTSPVSFDLGIAGGYLFAGTRLPVGGGTIVPHARVSLAIREWASVYYTQSPILVTPSSLDQMGFVDVNDLGAAAHAALGRVTVGLGGSIAPAYLRWCNRLWCLREWTVLGGVETHAQVRVLDGWSIHVQARLLVAQPTAWTWPGLPASEREPIPTVVTLVGGGSWGR